MDDMKMSSAISTIEEATCQKDLEILLEAIKKKKENLENIAEERARKISIVCQNCQWQIEKQVSTLFPNFTYDSDIVYLQINVIDMINYLFKHGYKVETPLDKLQEQDNVVFTLEHLDFENIYQDDFKDVIIPVTL